MSSGLLDRLLNTARRGSVVATQARRLAPPVARCRTSAASTLLLLTRAADRIDSRAALTRSPRAWRRGRPRMRARRRRGRYRAAIVATDQAWPAERRRSEEHTSELQSRLHLVCRLLLEKKSYHANHHAAQQPLVSPQTLEKVVVWLVEVSMIHSRMFDRHATVPLDDTAVAACQRDPICA